MSTAASISLSAALPAKASSLTLRGNIGSLDLL